MADIIHEHGGEIEPGATQAPHQPEPPATEAPTPEPVASEPPATEPPATVAAAPKPTKAPWFMDRIGEETAKRQQAERENQELRQRLARFSTTSPSQASQAFVPAQPGVSEDAVQAEVARREFAAKTRSVRDAGITEFGAVPFQEAMNGYSVLGDEPQVAQFIESALETDAPHKVLHFLGTNQEEGKRIMSLSPRKQAIEMERLAAKLNAGEETPVSKAPAPIKPVGGNSVKAEVDPSKMSTAAWMEWRDKDVQEKQKRGMRIH